MTAQEQDATARSNDEFPNMERTVMPRTTSLPSPRAARRNRHDWMTAISRYGTLSTLVLLVAVFGVARPDVFATRLNFLHILNQSAILLAVSSGLTVCLVVGLFDLSIAAVATAGNYFVVAILVTQGGDADVWPAILLVLAVCGLIGAASGWIVSYLGVPAFVGTLAVGSILSGIVIGVSQSRTIVGGIPDAFLALGQEHTFGIPNPVLIVAVVLGFLWVLLEHTQTGRNLYAIGGNREAARLSGISVRRYALLALAISAICAGLGGMISAANLGAGRPTGVGDAYLLNAFAAAFIGASTLRPGQFHIFGTVVGVLIIAVIGNGLSMLGVPTYWQYIVQGALLILAMVTAGVVSRKS